MGAAKFSCPWYIAPVSSSRSLNRRKEKQILHAKLTRYQLRVISFTARLGLVVYLNSRSKYVTPRWSLDTSAPRWCWGRCARLGAKVYPRYLHLRVLANKRRGTSPSSLVNRISKLLIKRTSVSLLALCCSSSAAANVSFSFFSFAWLYFKMVIIISLLILSTCDYIIIHFLYSDQIIENFHLHECFITDTLL